MELEQTEQEQVEALQKWWSENWKSLLGGLVLGLGGILGWQYYGDVRLEQAAAASQAYEGVKAKLAVDKLDEARDGLMRLADEHGGSPYVVHAQLALAQAEADAGDWAAAEATLRQAIEQAGNTALEGLSRLRLAQALWAQDKADAALAELEQPDAQAYAPLYAVLRGDIAAARGDTDTAREAYELALASQADYVDRGGIQRKLDALN